MTIGSGGLSHCAHGQEAGRNAGVPLDFSSLFSLRPLPMEWCIHVQSVSSLSEDTLTVGPRAVPMVIPNLVRFAITLT